MHESMMDRLCLQMAEERDEKRKRNAKRRMESQIQRALKPHNNTHLKIQILSAIGVAGMLYSSFHNLPDGAPIYIASRALGRMIERRDDLQMIGNLTEMTLSVPNPQPPMSVRRHDGQWLVASVR